MYVGFKGIHNNLTQLKSQKQWINGSSLPRKVRGAWFSKFED